MRLVFLIIVGVFAALLIGGAMLSGRPQKSSEIEMTSTMRREVTALIQAKGLNCPAVKLAFARGEDARGTVMRVYCGPPDEDGIYKKGSVRLTARPDGAFLVEPWN